MIPSVWFLYLYTSRRWFAIFRGPIGEALAPLGHDGSENEQEDRRKTPWLGGRAASRVERRGNNWVFLIIFGWRRGLVMMSNRAIDRIRGIALISDTTTLQLTEKFTTVLCSVHFLWTGSLKRTEKIFILGKHVA